LHKETPKAAPKKMDQSKEIENYLADHRAFENNGASGAPAWLKDLRSDAIEKFSELGFPTVKQEDWRFTNILPLTKIPFQRSAKGHGRGVDREELLNHVFPPSSKTLLVFINGHFDAALSDLSGLPKEVSGGSLASLMSTHGEFLREHLNRDLPLQQHPFAALNAGFIHDGAFVHLPEGISVSAPIQMLFVTKGNSHRASYPRNLIVVEDKASATFLECYISLSEEATFTNAVTEAFIAKEAAVDFVKIQRESEHAFHVATMQVEQASGSRFTAFSLALGGAIARNDINIIVNGDRCETMLDGLYIAANDQLIDHHTFIDHRLPDCSSREIFKGIVAGNSRTVFNGKIFVRREAQKTDSKQTNKNLLLSDKATVDTKPQLEIFADDVKCTHGATVGGLDAASLFYVKSRGISEDAARAVLTVGFAGEVTNYINDEALRKHVDSLVIGRLQDTVMKIPLPEIVHSETKSV
jgi:Fe-S cluster assembly protein SufD